MADGSRSRTSEPGARSVMNRAMEATEALSSISLPNSAPNRNSGKNCAIKREALSIKVCVQ